MVTNVAALNETVQCGDIIKSRRIYTDQYAQRKFIKAVVAALQEGKTGTPVKGTDWSDVARAWGEYIHGRQ